MLNNTNVVPVVDEAFVANQDTVTFPVVTYGDEDVRDVCGKIVAFQKLDGYRIVNHAGPSGGWPEVTFYGSPQEIAVFIDRYENHDTVY